jgi:hypothetical protein
MNKWAPLALQTLALIVAGWGFAAGQEHRVTVIEETLKSQAMIIQQVSQSNQILAQQVQEIQRTQARLVALEELIHRTK